MHYDTIVIGSGIGGLTSASCLAVLGKKVIMIEKDKEIGGLTRSYKRKNWEFNSGLHIHNWPVKDQDKMQDLWEILTGGNSPWEKCSDQSTKFIYPGYTFTLKNGIESYRDSLIKLFPKEKNKIDEYLRDMNLVSHEFVNFSVTTCMKDWKIGKAANFVLGRTVKKFDNITVLEYFNQKKIPQDLQNHLAFFWDNYGMPPSKASFTTHCIFAASFIENSFIQKSPSIAIANAFTGTLKNNNVDIITGDGLESFIINGRKITGVKLDSGREILADNVISTIGIIESFKYFPQDFLPEGTDKLGQNTYSFVIANFGFDSKKYSPPEGALWLYNQDKIDIEMWEDINQPPPYVNYFNFSTEKNMAQCMLIVENKMFDKWKDTVLHKRGDDYNNFMDQIGKSIACTVDSFFNGFQENIEFTDLASPLTIRDYTFHKNGACYGIGAFPGRYNLDFIKPGTGLRGLYFGGQDICTTGIVGGFLGGIMSVISLMKKDIIKEILRINRG